MRQPAKPKYSLLEIERRWLVDASLVPPLDAASAHRIEDRYLAGTRLRVRQITAPDGAVAMKLCKKYGRGDTLAEPITNIYLDAAEHASLAAVPGATLDKQRFAVGGGSLDVHGSPNPGLMLFEMQFDSVEAAATFRAPAFALTDVTHDRRYDGDRLAREPVVASQRRMSTE
jgi:CYTH domain-containing protein